MSVHTSVVGAVNNVSGVAEELAAKDDTPAKSAKPAEYHRMTRDEANAFMADNVALIHSVLKPFKGCEDYEDLFQEASIGFYKGIMSYNPRFGVKISTFCFECAKNEVKMLLRRNSAKSRTASVISLDGLQDPDSGKYDNMLERSLTDKDSLHPVTEDIGDTVSNKEVVDAAMSIIRNEMSPEEQLVIQRFMEGQPQAITAKEIGASQAKVSKILKYAMSKLNLAMHQRNLVPTP